MSWAVEFTDEFEEWWHTLNVTEQASVARGVRLLEERGPGLTRPFSDVIHGSRFAQMKELRIQHAGQPYRVLYAFDPLRRALLLLGGNKTGDNRWYERWLPIAERIFEEHLREIEQEQHKKE